MSTYNEMKKKAESDQNRIELRSEKVRNMIGEMPSFLIRWGNTILVVIFVLLALIAWFALYLGGWKEIEADAREVAVLLGAHK